MGPEGYEAPAHNLDVAAVLATGALHQGLRSASGPGTGVLVLVSGLALAGSVIQAAHILTLLAGPPRLPRRGHLHPHPRRTTTTAASTAPSLKEKRRCPTTQFTRRTTLTRTRPRSAVPLCSTSAG
ncbi:hypothetical protein [Streptomyces shenzhenensis]|uniref:hypothetical protein n=1 Tax=Streptomyces shenzhenensis TaxID=943815 RepID=UPI001F1D358D|nr:hypothetical protein [Streptomyces shenzhenensis]